MARNPRGTTKPLASKRGRFTELRRVKQLRLADEVRHIQRCAANRDGRVVSVGALVLFSTATGDAWMLDPGDHFAARVARDGAPEAIKIDETSTAFAVHWPGSYRVEGPSFIYTDRQTGRVMSVLGYPTDLLDSTGES